MSDFKIINLINGGARISEYRSGFSEQSPIRCFDISKQKFDEVIAILNEHEQGGSNGS